MGLLTYRVTLFSLLTLLLALTMRPAPPNRPHPLCHPLPFLCYLLHTRPQSTTPLTRALISIPSPSGSESRALHYAANWLRHERFVVQTQTIPPLEPNSQPRLNILALRPGASVTDIRILLFTHLDVVPGSGRGSTKTGVVQGRGAVDAKAQAAGMMIAARQMDDKRVGLLLVCGEETDHGGVIAASTGLGLREDVVLVNGEPTESRLGRVQKGMQRVTLRARGRSAHSGYPELGESAVDKLLDVLGELRAVEWGEGEGGVRTTMNIGELRGGVAANVVASEAMADVMFRVGVEPRGVVDKVVELAEKGGVEVEVGMGNGPVEFLVPPRVGSDLGVVDLAYNTDVAYWKGGYRAAVLFGAGSIANAHTDDEWVTEEELERLPERLERIVAEVLEGL